MSRRNEIRAAMQSLLSSEWREGSVSTGRSDPDTAPVQEMHADLAEITHAAQARTLEELQIALREHGIQAEPVEIVGAILQATLVRPKLCRGLLAAYFLETEQQSF